MPTVPLPNDPDLDQLRRQAKELRRAVARGDADAIEEVVERHPRGDAAVAAFALSAAQLVIARRHGFAGWPALKRHVDVVRRLRRAPDAATVCADVADEFLRLACLTYAGDAVERRRQAAVLLADHPELGRASIHTAAATADAPAVRAFLRADPTAAAVEAGPYRWTPLLYLAYARHDPDIDSAAVLATARALLAAGADPNAGYLWHGLPSAFTVLTGVFGEGEQGPRDQPRHPHAQRLARLLLEAGADPNDSQALYNRMFEPANDHLELLFEFGLGRGDGGPWRALLGAATMSPSELVASQLDWAVTHDMVERVRLLLAHGARPDAVLGDGRRATDAATVAGHRAVLALLVEAGAAAPALDPVDELIGLLAAGDRAACERIVAAHPRRLDGARARRPSLIVDAVAADRPDAVRLLLDLGFDVNALGRGDAPRNGRWETALHVAAGDGRLALAELLLANGADPGVRDARFDSTPLGWARHFGRPALVALLHPRTPEPEQP